MNDVFRFYAVIGLLDDTAQKTFYELWHQLAVKSLVSRVTSDGLPPHITLAAYEGLTDEMVLSWVDSFCKKEFQLPINFNHMGTFFDQTVFIAPRVTEELLAFHKRYHSYLEEYHGEIGWIYTPSSEEWVPHATVMHNSPEENKAAIPILMEQFIPFKTSVC